MSAFTSNSTGNWSVTSTWTPAGVPQNGDTATIASPNNVTVNSDITVGDGSSSAITVQSGAILTIADNVTLTVVGGIDNQGDIEYGVNSQIVFITNPFPFVAACDTVIFRYQDYLI